MSMQEVQSRITHNHLAMASQERRALYIDAELRVILIDIDETTLLPSFRIVHELPQPIQTCDATMKHPEYPSAVLLSNTAFVSDGHGSLFVVDIQESGPSRLCGSYELRVGSERAIAFRIHEVSEASPNSALIVLSSRYHTDEPADRRKTVPVEFDLWASRISFSSSEPLIDTQLMVASWRRRGGHPPINVHYDASRQAHLVLGGSMYRRAEMPAPSMYDPSDDELAPIPHTDENLDASDRSPAKPPPYSWTQSHDEVTIAFPLPSSTNKSDIHVAFSLRTLTVHVHPLTETAVPHPHYSMKQLWDGIQTSTSFWTWDREAESSFGLLTLHLDKQNDGTRWMQVFSSAGTSVNPEDQSDIEVPETLDPSELSNIRESLEKYTTSLQNGQDASGLGLGTGVSSLADGEMDDEVDSSVGRQAYVTWVDANGTTLNPNDEIPFNLLSTPVPGTSSQMSLVVKNHIDGVSFSLPPSEDPPNWKHDCTFSALAFVLATKQDTRFTFHVPGKAVLAFENGARDRGGNLYAYRSAPSGDKVAKQVVLKLSDGSAGSLLGVGAMQIAGKSILLCLCEGVLVVVRNLL
ncbi:hypothetical protein FIBSPDRAFT_1036140 [Athelia psychrophila]|uniref:NudC domain-containing protein 1 n=1 Tax=Athelia psychrophila TaxID=1759441 RepID=A0A166WC42_9AGAM|nr:hypothetical protein FIBSPDRAFT_1036140 [Fibularhizoctonia sp. CBS 109695]